MIQIERDSDQQPSWSEIAKKVGCTVNQARYWYERGEDISDHKSPGRPKKVTEEIKQNVYEMTLTKPSIGCTELAQKIRNISAETVRNIRHTVGFRFINYIKKAPLTQQQKKYRCEFAKYYLENVEELKKICFY